MYIALEKNSSQKFLFNTFRISPSHLSISSQILKNFNSQGQGNSDVTPTWRPLREL